MPRKAEQQRRDAERFGVLPIPRKAELINKHRRKEVHELLDTMLFSYGHPENLKVLESRIKLARKKVEHVPPESLKIVFAVRNERDGSMNMSFYLSREETYDEYHSRLYTEHLIEERLNNSVEQLLKKNISKTKEMIEGNPEFEKAIGEFIQQRKSKNNASTNDN